MGKYDKNVYFGVCVEVCDYVCFGMCLFVKMGLARDNLVLSTLLNSHLL